MVMRLGWISAIGTESVGQHAHLENKPANLDVSLRRNKDLASTVLISSQPTSRRQDVKFRGF